MSLLVAWLVASVAACGDDPPPPLPPPPPEPIPRPPLVGTRGIATSAAFDLVAMPYGALLVFGPPADQGGGVRGLRLDAVGSPRGDEVEIYRVPERREPGSIVPYATEVAAASAAGRFGAVFVLSGDNTMHAHAVYGPDSLEALAPVAALGDVGLTRWGGARGDVSIAASTEGALSLFVRAGMAPCSGAAMAAPAGGEGAAEPEGGGPTCVRFRGHHLGAPPSIREGEGLLVPEPCDGALAGHVWSHGAWFYGLCARENGVVSTTAYAIQPDPQYARAERLLAGLEPIGLAAAEGGGAILVAGDPASPAAVRIGPTASSVVVQPAERGVRCTAGLPELKVTGAGHELSLPLSGPASRIEALLPDPIAPPGARAVWTGEAILVAVPVSRDVAVRRFQCEGGEIARTEMF